MCVVGWPGNSKDSWWEGSMRQRREGTSHLLMWASEELRGYEDSVYQVE